MTGAQGPCERAGLDDAQLTSLLADAEQIALQRARDWLADVMFDRIQEQVGARLSAPATDAPAPPINASHEIVVVYGVVGREARGAAVEGIDGSAVTQVPADDLVAVASHVDGARFDNATSGDLRDGAPGEDSWLAHAVRAHDDVVAQLFSGGTVLPMRFGTAFASEADVHTMLAECGAGLRAELRRLDGRAEWTVKARTAAVTGPSTGDGDPAQSTTGAGYLRARHEDNRRAEAARADGRLEARALHEQLAAHASEYMRIPAARAGGASTVLHASYLMPRTLDVRDLLRSQPRDAVSAEISGPWAPYHFVRLPEGS